MDKSTKNAKYFLLSHSAIHGDKNWLTYGYEEQVSTMVNGIYRNSRTCWQLDLYCQHHVEAGNLDTSNVTIHHTS